MTNWTYCLNCTTNQSDPCSTDVIMRYHELFNWHAGKYQQGLEGAMEICFPVSHYHLTGKTRIYIHRARKRSRIPSTLWFVPALPRRRRVIKKPLFLRIFLPFLLLLKKTEIILFQLATISDRSQSRQTLNVGWA